jgi:hypothetical protein
MRELHAGLLVMQGLPIIVGLLFALWIAYYVRVAVIELREVRKNLEKLNYYFEADTRPSTPSASETRNPS